MNPVQDKESAIIIEEIVQENPYRLVFSQPLGEYRKAVITPKIIGGKKVWQTERLTEKQAFHENFPYEALAENIQKILGKEFRQLHAFSAGLETAVKVTSKGKLLIHRTASKVNKIEAAPNNRKKRYLLPEGTVVPPLQDMGIFTKDGRVVNAMYDKYKQINRFLEMVDDVIQDEKKLHIIDFGCGKSYLTFIVYYYLTEVRKMDVSITGLDLKEDVIRKCNETAAKYQYRNLKFVHGDINDYETDGPVDMVMTLHACDTATDHALYHAIQWKAKYILSVPCCQHEVNREISCDTLMPLMKYGIIKQRTSELVTDSLRAELLEACGYKTQLLEFIDLSHSPKNLLIRAVKTDYSEKRREKSMEEALTMCRFFHVNPTLLRLLNKNQ